jgi:hypothetical protein
MFESNPTKHSNSSLSIPQLLQSSEWLIAHLLSGNLRNYEHAWHGGEWT